mmetsp:Transcript_26571/g.37431  ORF Transcript_26571/g.37431 Transcript_26571/m.37431 type:complete len:127 (-) Transcript_26571:167-547(-)
MATRHTLKRSHRIENEMNQSCKTLASKSYANFFENACDLFSNCGYTLNQVEMEFQQEHQPSASIPSSPSVVEEVLNRINFEQLDDVELFRWFFVEEKDSFDALKKAIEDDERSFSTEERYSPARRG